MWLAVGAIIGGRSDAVSETALGGWKDWGQPNKDSVMPANAPVVSQARPFH